LFAGYEEDWPKDIKYQTLDIEIIYLKNKEEVEKREGQCDRKKII